MSDSRTRDSSTWPISARADSAGLTTLTVNSEKLLRQRSARNRSRRRAAAKCCGGSKASDTPGCLTRFSKREKRRNFMSFSDSVAGPIEVD